MKAAAPRWLKMAEVVPITSWPRLARPSAPCDAGGATPGIQGGITLAVTQSGISTRLRFAGPSSERGGAGPSSLSELSCRAAGLAVPEWRAWDALEERRDAFANSGHLFQVS